MITIDNEQFVNLQIPEEPIDGAIQIYQGADMLAPEITVAVKAIPRIIKVLKQIHDSQKGETNDTIRK